MNSQPMGIIIPQAMTLVGRVIRRVENEKLRFANLSLRQIRVITSQEWKKIKRIRKNMGIKIKLTSRQEREINKSALRMCAQMKIDLKKQNS